MRENAVRKRILIVDDETDIRLVIRTLLNAAGYEVEDAQDGEAALQKLSSKHFDLMVLDIMMPKMDGYALMEQLKKREICIPVVMLTVKADHPSLWKSYQQGAALHMTKPFESEKLVDAVNYLVGDISKEERRRIETTL